MEHVIIELHYSLLVFTNQNTATAQLSISSKTTHYLHGSLRSQSREKLKFENTLLNTRISIELTRNETVRTKRVVSAK